MLATLLLAGGACADEPDKARRWEAGAFTFSDELGGFRITAVTGIGTRADPIVITEEFESASPATLIIRARPNSGQYINTFAHMRIDVLNDSMLPWIEFSFELQERRNVPSGFGDGLSFDQRRTDSPYVGSNSFTRFSRDFEPADKLLFTQGSIDHRASGSFDFLVTDFTPRPEFYLIQDPRIPSS